MIYVKKIVKYILIVVIILFLLAMLISPVILEFVMSRLFPGHLEYVYSRSTIVDMTGEHLLLVVISSLISITLGISGGIFATRQIGNDFLPIIKDISSLMQTFPPVAVLALAVPLIGFGFEPAILALVLYSILPILNNTISGLKSVSRDVVDSAFGMGMSRMQVLYKIELPIAFPVIFAGVRISVIINIGTATLGALVGAGGLGAPITSGLVRNNNAFVFQGALATALLALLVDRIFALVERKIKKG